MKALKWIGTLILFFAAMFYATQSRKEKRRSGEKSTREIQELSKNKSASLGKAQKFEKQAKTHLNKATTAKDTSDALVEELESRNETGLANRVRDFNNRL